MTAGARLRRRPGHGAALAATLAAVLMLVSACASSANTASSSRTVTFAEEPSTPPNFILPLVSASDYINANVSDFSELLYPPLYWFGNGGVPELNPALSLAYPPVFSNGNQTVTVKLKHWLWSDGQPVTARDVIFWMNLVSAVTDPNAPTVPTPSGQPGPSWAAAVPGGFPVNIVSYAEVNTYTVVFHLNAAYNPRWYLYNELSQITPLPQHAWDRLISSGAVGDYDSSAEARGAVAGTTPLQYLPNDPGTATAGALGVAAFLNAQSEQTATYDTNPLWRVVDGPFRLAAYTTNGYAKFVPNRSYSGPSKPEISAFVELPFTSDQAEFAALRSGSLTIGYLPYQDIRQKTFLTKNEGYTFSPWYVMGIDQFYYNYTDATAGPLVSQLYFRQALQSLVNQPQYIKEFTAGTGTIDNGPVPTYPPKSPDLSPLEAGKPIYPYDPTKAASLLRAQGWHVVPGGVSTCSRPGTRSGECGAGVQAGQPATLSVIYLIGSTIEANEVAAMQSAMKAGAGIDLTVKAESYGSIGGVIYGCTPSTPCDNWQVANYTLQDTWVYFPDYLPTGGELFGCGSGSNAGDYCSNVNDANIAATHTAPTNAAETEALYRYEDYLAQQLPYLEVPNVPYQLTVYKSDLSGVVPQGIYGELYPQNYRFH